MLDRRKAQRYPAHMSGRIVFDRHFATVDCLVRNLSEHGVRLVFDESTFIPNAFELAIPRRNVSYRVHARWRRAGEMGVEIERAAAASESEVVIPIALARRLRKLERENAELRRDRED